MVISLPFGAFLMGGRTGIGFSSSISSSSSFSGRGLCSCPGGSVLVAFLLESDGLVRECGRVRPWFSFVPQPGQKLAEPGSFFPQLWQNWGVPARFVLDRFLLYRFLDNRATGLHRFRFGYQFRKGTPLGFCYGFFHRLL